MAFSVQLQCTNIIVHISTKEEEKDKKENKKVVEDKGSKMRKGGKKGWKRKMG
jgi:hypothetical protein